MNRRDPVESLSELGDLLESLSSRPVVAVRSGQLPDGADPGHGLAVLAGQVHELVAEIHSLWERYVPSGVALPSVSEIEARLEPLSFDAAIDVMTALAADDFVWSNRVLMNREIAHNTVTRIVKCLGPGATWCCPTLNLPMVATLWPPTGGRVEAPLAGCRAGP